MKDIMEFLKEHRYDELDENDIQQFVTEAKTEEDTDKQKSTDDESRGGEQKPEAVKYAELGQYNCIFDNIILFTNDDDPKNNKTLKNIYDAIDNIKKHAKKDVKLYVFIAEKTTYDINKDTNELTITDDKTTLKFTNENNTNTLVFSRLGVQGEDDCEYVVEMLQDRGFLVLNPIRYSQLASNKYETAELLQRGEVPQPNFCYMSKKVLYDEKEFNDAMKAVYKEWDPKDMDKNEDLKFVVKILDGHGGTGVALIDGKKLTAWLQLVFAIDPERDLIIQRKEEADGGDIRVHVLTLRNKQVILAAMKRVKLGGDFRSNVSLGAEAEPVKLTPEQEQIALKAATLSCLPWCAVDIMPLVKGSNPTLGDNAVLELNASPGTNGITDVIKENFVNVLINQLDDPTEFYLQDKTAGFIETVQVDFGDGEVDVLAKLDTGNGAIASHMEVADLEEKGNYVSFKFNGKQYKFKVTGHSKPVTGTQQHDRPVIKLPEMRLGNRVLKNIDMALVPNRDGKSTNMLLNRTLMSYLGYVVNPCETHLLTTEMEKVNIIG